MRPVKTLERAQVVAEEIILQKHHHQKGSDEIILDF
jgi:hypothetical protein